MTLQYRLSDISRDCVISFSTAERSPKCNSTQEKSPWPCEQCVKMSFYLKQHQDTLYIFYWSTNWTSAVCTILCLFNWKFWSNWSHNWHKLGPMISPHGGDNMLARLEAGVNTFPHISQMKYFCQSFVSFEWESQNVPLYGKTKLWTRAFI